MMLYFYKECKVNSFNAYMSYRKFRADHLFTGGQWLDDQHVLVASQEGDIEDIVPLAGAGDDIQVLKGILSPGFINCHCHLELSHLKGVIPEKTGMVDFLLSVMAQRNFLPEQVAAAIADAELSMLRNGIVATGDICNTALTLAQKRQGRMYYHNFIEAMGFVEQVAERRMQESIKVFEQFASIHSTPIAYNSIVPHAPYSVSPKLFDIITHFPGNQLLTMHNQESMAENEFFGNAAGDLKRLYETLNIDISFFKAAGKSSLRHCISHFLRNQTVVLVHNAFTSAEDVQDMSNSEADFYFCLCPNANLYIGNPIPNIDMLRKSPIPIVIGTDSLASNHQLSIISELKTIHQHFPAIPIFELLQWATINGARALDIDKYLGKFEKGLQPGIVLIENDLSAAKRVM
jgi:aminodeoxyfutalosine deaminase